MNSLKLQTLNKGSLSFMEQALNAAYLRAAHRELIVRVIVSFILLYLFLVGVKTLSTGLNLMGDGFARSLFDVTANPISSLMAGMLATVLFQSSSVTTSIIVGLVAAGTLPVAGAVPMVMGANLGTSVTNTLVSLGFVRNKSHFKRAFAAATVHDFFNILTVLVLLPLEIAFGFIEKISTVCAGALYGSQLGGSFSSPIKTAIKPVAHAIESFSASVFSANAAPVFMLIFSGVIIFISLTLIVKVMSKIVAEQEGHLLDKVFSKNSYAALAFGVVATICAQSSSITTALLVPLAGSGLLTVQAVYPVTVGANIGTTATALLAAMTGNMAGLAIALVHLFFNLIGTLLFFVVPFTRYIPIRLAEKLADSIDRTKFIGLGYVASVFFIIPISMLYLMKL